MCTSQTGCFQLFRHVWSEVVFFLVSGILAASVLHVVVPVTGGESHFFPSSSCFSGHWHAARQYVASQCELPCPAGWQREKRHTHTHACTNKTGRCLQVEAKMLHLRHFLLAPITPTTSPPVRQIWQQSNLKKPNPCSKQEDASVSASWKFVSCEEKRGV